MLQHMSAPRGNDHVSKAEIDFMLEYAETLRTLFRAKLFEVIEGSTHVGGREWDNVIKHSIGVARSLKAIGELLGMSPEECHGLAQVGLIHDWNKRLTKDASSFTPEERADAEAYANQILAEHDPDGHLIDATEPRGLPRLESDAATLAEHCVHFIDLSCMPKGLVTTEERFADLLSRHATVNYDTENPGFWNRKKELTTKEESMFLDRIRERGIEVPEGTRLCDLLKDELTKA